MAEGMGTGPAWSPGMIQIGHLDRASLPACKGPEQGWEGRGNQPECQSFLGLRHYVPPLHCEADALCKAERKPNLRFAQK